MIAIVEEIEEFEIFKKEREDLERSLFGIWQNIEVNSFRLGA